MWFRGGGLHSFRDIQQFPVPGGVGWTLRAISNVLHILHVTHGTRKYIYGSGVGISIIFEIFSNFPFLRDGINSRGHI
jgi:hypothetical protein